MTPNCIKLGQNQLDKLDKFKKFVIEKIGEKSYNRSDTCGTSHFTFHVLGSGIGDSIWVTGFGYKCGLTLDDDGEVFSSEGEFDYVEDPKSILRRQELEKLLNNLANEKNE